MLLIVELLVEFPTRILSELKRTPTVAVFMNKAVVLMEMLPKSMKVLLTVKNPLTLNSKILKVVKKPAKGVPLYHRERFPFIYLIGKYKDSLKGDAYDSFGGGYSLTNHSADNFYPISMGITPTKTGVTFTCTENKVGVSDRTRTCNFRLRRAERSEERRVGKECRSRWSPYH